MHFLDPNGILRAHGHALRVAKAIELELENRTETTLRS